jgi:hypothetical protein
MPVNPTAAAPRKARRRLAPSLPAAPLLAAIALAAGGCGGSSPSGTSIDPADAVPASAPLYAGAVVRPEGSLQIAARTAGRTLTHQADPYLRLLAALQTPGSSSADFKRDVAPWLGPRAGVFLDATGSSEEQAIGKLLSLLEQGLLGSSSATASFPFAAHSVEGAILLDTRDTAKARSFLQGLAGRAGAHTASYRGISYQATASGIAFGIVARLAVIGTEPGLHAVIDTTSGGPALARAPGYAKLLAAAPADALAHVYANASAFGGGAGVRPQGTASAFSLLAGGGELNVSLVPANASIALDADSLRTSTSTPTRGLFASSSEAAAAMGELPGESWLAVGLGHVGSTLGADVDALQGVFSLGSQLTSSSPEGQSGLSVKGLLEGVLAPLRALSSNSAETKRDFSSWMGSAGLFASGTGLLELKGGVVIDSDNASLSRAAVAKLGAKLRQGGGSVQSISIPGTDAALAARLTGLPVVLDIAAGTDSAGHSKFIIGIGEASVQAALDPSSPLSGTAPFSAASTALGRGAQPSVIVDFPTLLGLLEGIGLSEDPSISPFVPYLRSLSTLSGGSQSLGGDIQRFRLVLGLQGGG